MSVPNVYGSPGNSIYCQPATIRTQTELLVVVATDYVLSFLVEQEKLLLLVDDIPNLNNPVFVEESEAPAVGKERQAFHTTEKPAGWGRRTLLIALLPKF